VYRNLLLIPGISSITAKKLCAFMGISINTIYSKLSRTKMDNLNGLLSVYKKKTNPLLLKSVSDLSNNNNISIHFSPKREEKTLYFPYFNSLKVSEPQKQNSQNIIHTPILTGLKTFNKNNILTLITLNSYRGRRIKQGYPARGQRTRSNAKTARKLLRAK
jgi:ribosomal protein S13